MIVATKWPRMKKTFVWNNRPMANSLVIRKTESNAKKKRLKKILKNLLILN